MRGGRPCRPRTAERDVVEQIDEQQRALDLELQQADYAVELTARRYHAVDRDNRLVAIDP